MHGTFKEAKPLQKIPQQEKQDTPNFLGPDWWLFKAMHDPVIGPKASRNLALFSPKSPECKPNI